MLQIFSEYKKIWFALESTIFMFSAALIHDKHPVWLIVLFAALSSIFAFFAAELLAVKKHQDYLSILYNSKDAEAFLHIYLPLTRKPEIRANILFTMHMHLCNAYLALGDQDSAVTCLQDLPKLPKKSYKKGEQMLAMQHSRIAEMQIK